MAEPVAVEMKTRRRSSNASARLWSSPSLWRKAAGEVLKISPEQTTDYELRTLNTQWTKSWHELCGWNNESDSWG
jgi:hypothetical protein